MTFLELSLSGGVFILAIAAFRALTLRRLPKGTFVTLWWLAAARLLLPVDFSRWQDPRTVGWNCFLLALLALGALAAGLAAAGVLRGRRPAAR